MQNQTHPSRNTILAITSYPNPGSGLYGPRESFSAVCWHSERILTELSKYHTVHVFANTPPDSIGTFSMGEHLHIRRIWEKGNWISILTLPLRILRIKTIDTIYVPFEFSVFGGIIPNLILLLDLLILRIMGKNIVFELHQIIEDIHKLEKHIHIYNRVIQWIMNVGLRQYYRLVGHIAHTIIVFETELVERFSHYAPRTKIHLSSIPADTLSDDERVTQSKAKKKLGYRSRDYVIMVFGYVNEYKGIDWILNAVKHIPSKRVRLLFAGGPNPYHAHKREYQNYYNSILKRTSRDTRVQVTGFIPDKDIPMYFQACDLVALPYTVFMSASGPFSWAVSYHKPVLLSNTLKDYMKSADVAQAMRQSGVSADELFFPLQHKAFAKRIHRLITDPAYGAKLSTLSELLHKKRDIKTVVADLYTVLALQESVERVSAGATVRSWFARIAHTFFAESQS